MKMFYLGPEGTFSQEPAQQFSSMLGYPDAELVAKGTIIQVIEEVHQAVLDGQPDVFGCVPLENSIQGSVTMTWDMLGKVVSGTTATDPASASDSLAGPQILASLTLPIEHYLLMLEGTRLEEVEEVISHPQALAQCQNSLSVLVPNARFTPVASTADAARTVASEGKTTVVAVGTRQAGIRYGLEWRKQPVQDRNDNKTRFGLIGKQIPQGRLAAKVQTQTLSLLLSGVANAPGGLYQTLQPFHDFQINLSRIESRPAGTRLGQYVFYIDAEWPASDVNGQAGALDKVFEALHAQQIGIFQLGLFPELQVTTQTV
ncbi:prephenate dehydratase [Alicyclobacillus tolerans]|uniref:prephenate dehydratase n=1 Tax=Alicyclobacillus tolerans TaxID=90970 RepID=UPI001F01C44D|nr:prephenate dehydratase [Alicyclobacillus tolerans]MCF8564788.1 prephenate dehydratase [Alicyclobacillus tolerans]